LGLSAARLHDFLRRLPPAPRCHLALSGGLDSCVLLHLLVSLRHELPWELAAIHVHHGLQPQADTWLSHCRALCEGYRIPFTGRRLELSPAPGESLEALAREARYQALAGEMGEGELLLTAQHRDDQAETLLLQLLRGSGPAGLAAMPELARFGPGWLARPLLSCSRDSLEAYAGRQGLSWAEDPSNRELRFDRNFIRHEVMPLLRRRWPSAAATLARSARLSGELLALAREEGEEDLGRVRREDPLCLDIAALRSFDSARLRNLLRQWFLSQGVKPPDSRRLQRIEGELVRGRRDAVPVVAWGRWEVRRYRDDLMLLPRREEIPEPAPLIWSEGDSLQLPGGLGRLVAGVGREGLSEACWRRARIEVRFRHGGERCLPAGQAHHRALKKLFQEWGIPPWERGRIPLVYLDGQLALIPGRLVCQPFAAPPGEAAIQIRWERGDP